MHVSPSSVRDAGMAHRHGDCGDGSEAAMHHQMWNIFLKGLGAILPVGLTLYLIYWMGRSIEAMLRPAILSVIPDYYYIPGMGLAAGLVLLFFIGVAVNAWIFRRILRAGEDLLEHIPLVKSIYRALRDFVDFFSAKGGRGEMRQVVLVSVAGLRLLGFITRERISDIPGLPQSDNVVAVYLPMSYQIGGFTIYLPRSQVETVDMSAEEAMRIILMAGLSQAHGSGTPFGTAGGGDAAAAMPVHELSPQASLQTDSGTTAVPVGSETETAQAPEQDIHRHAARLRRPAERRRSGR
jgi:uncharacterized membrane protein